MGQAIPISQVVTINPGVVGTGSNPLALNGIFVGQNPLIPVGNLLTIYSQEDAQAWFGSDSYEAKLATVYFNGFQNARKYPSQLFYYAYAKEVRGAWARGTSLKGMTLVELKTISGTLSVSINGTAYNGDIDLSSVTDFTSAAAAIQTSLGVSGEASVTWDPMTSRFVITVITTPATSEISQITGTAATRLGFASAVRSQGSDVTSLTDTLNALKELSLNWATFSFVEQFDMAEMVEAAQWNNSQNSRYFFVNSDNDPNALVAGNEENFGVVSNIAKYEGLGNLFDANDDPLTKAFVMGYAASIDWKRLNGRATAAFRSQDGLPTTCNNITEAKTLLANGYSYYGQYAAAGPDNTYAFLYDGRMPGKFRWFDTYINQIYLNAQLQIGVIDMLLALNSMPYNDEGYALLRASVMDAIREAINNGTIRAGVRLSESQKAQITSQVGFDITNELYTQGWYFQIVDADAQTRGNRQSPPINFFYCDGGSIQQVTIPSIAIL